MPLDRDRLLALQQRTEIPDPTGKPAGWTLTITGGDDAFDWRNPPEAETLTWHGNPDGDLTAQKGRLCRDIDTPALYQNVDGDTTWQQVGAVTANVSGYYVVGTPVVTNVPDSSITNLGWPGFTIGTDILDLSTVDTPLTTAAGEWTFNVTVALAAGEAPGDQVLVLIRLTDGTTPYGAETHATLLGSASDDDVISLSLTAVLAAGATVEVKALQTSGSTITLRMDVAAVTGPPS